MGTQIAAAIEQITAKSGNMCIFTSDFIEGSYEFSGTGSVRRFISEDSEPVMQLCYNHAVHPADSNLLTAFCSDILESRSTPVPDDRFSVSFRAKLSEDGAEDYSWLKLTVILDKDENMLIKRVVGFINLMNSADILNKSIIESFTSDKHPQVFMNHAKELLENEKDRQIAFIQLDIEKFKLINSRYGGDKGTEILNFISNGLDAVCSKEQFHMRMSADVFTIVTPFSDKAEIDSLINNIQEKLGRYEDISYKLVFGVYIVTNRTEPIRKMGDKAAMARQNIKGNALQNVEYYTEKLTADLSIRKDIEDRMYYALEHGEFVMYLQPKYSIKNEEIVGAEALTRWIHPEKGLISPAEFIPVFEQNGFIVKLDEYMWEQACKAIRSWIDAGVKPVPISINISRVHLENDKFIHTLDRLVEKYNISKDYLETEITETLDNAGAEAMIKKLKENGYMLLMDDFGSGYSSLNTLKSTPFDIIKIDREFLSEFMLSERGKKIIYHTISMSKDIGLDLVAEGVETKEQAEFLYDCGCTIAQGFYYSKPISLSDFEKKAFGK